MDRQARPTLGTMASVFSILLIVVIGLLRLLALSGVVLEVVRGATAEP